MPLALRPYQESAERRTFELWTKGKRSVLFVCPTGGGKSLTFSRIIGRYVAETGGRALLVADRESLVRQGADNVREHAGLDVGIEMADTRVDPMFMPPVVSATIQTIGRASRLERFRPDAFGLVVFDEADLSVAPSYKRVAEHFAGARIFGCTATPDRADGQALGVMYEDHAGIVEIRDLIEQGYLVNIRAKQIGEVDVSLVKTSRTSKDLDEAELSDLLTQEEHLHAVARPTLDLAGSRPTVIFGVTVKHAHALADVLNRYRPGCARAIDGSMDDDERRNVIDPFKRGEYQFLCNCALMTRGVDIPPIACVVMARPTSSRALLTQCVGRGTRALKGVTDGLDSDEARRGAIAASAKPDLLILDYAGVSSRLSLVSPMDVLDGNKDAEVRKRAKKKLAEEPEQTVLEALDAAANEIAEEKRRSVLAQTRYVARAVDPFAMVQTFLGITPRAGRWGGAPPRDEDLAYVAQRGKGIDVRGLDGGQVAEIVKAIRGRYKNERSSFNQAGVLIKHGLDPDVSAKAATIALDALAANGWKVTPEIRAAFDLVTEQRAALDAQRTARGPKRLEADARVADIDARRSAAFRALSRFSQARAGAAA